MGWITSWAGSAQGPFPIGNASAQPDLRFAFPAPDAGASDQTFRLILRPSLWGTHARMRLSNMFGTRPISIAAAYAGLQQTGSVIVPDSNQRVTFAGQAGVTIPPGAMAWSDPVPLRFVPVFADPSLTGRRLAVSLHLAGDSGPMTWHAKALTTSYVSPQGSGDRGLEDGVTGFPFTTTSWYFLDAVDMQAPAHARAVVAFGDSITDGTFSTLNGDDRWPDILLQRLHAAGITDVAVVNAGIGGNQVLGPPDHSPRTPVPGGPSALARLERDVIGLSGVAAVIWLEGINDLGLAGDADASRVIAGLRDGAGRLRNRLPGARLIGATLPPAKGSTAANHGHADQERERQALNAFIRNGGLFDAIADFDRAIADSATGAMRPEFVPDSTIGGAGDGLHPNRAGYAAMAAVVDLAALLAISGH